MIMTFIRNISSKNILLLQWITSFGAMSMLLTLGMTLGWTSPYLAKLTADDSPLPITSNEASWVASLLNFGRLVGAIVGGISVHFIDTKRTMVVLGFPLMLSNICMILANSAIWLYVARFLAGVSHGMAFSSFPIFLGEISSPSIRGTLVSLTMTGLALGTMIGNILGVYLSIAVFSAINLVPNAGFVLLFLWVPQSPHYLVRENKIEDAKRSVIRYNPNLDPDSEVQSLQKFIAASSSVTFGDRLREFYLPHNRKAGLISLGLYCAMQMSGLNNVIFYMEIILTSAQVTAISPSTLPMITSGVGVVSGWLAVYIADKFERKVLFIASAFGTGLSMAAMALHFTLLENGFDPEKLQWISIVSVLFLAFTVCNGLTTVPNIILSEFFAPNIKNLAACFGSISLGGFAFISSKSFQPLVDAVGMAWVFWGHSVLMVVSMIYAGVCLPKTRGKTLQEIQDILMRK